MSDALESIHEFRRTLAGLRERIKALDSEISLLDCSALDMERAVARTIAEHAEQARRWSAGEGREVLSRAEARAFLKISQSKLDRELKSGRLPCMRIGTTVRIRRADLEDFIRPKVA